MADSQNGPLDKLFRDTNVVILVIFGICCNWIAAILGLIGMLTGKDEKAKSNARLTLIVGVVSLAVWLILNFALGGMALLQGRR